MNWPNLKGWKAILCFALTFIISGLHALDVIDATIFQLLVSILGSLGLWALAAKGKRIEDKLNNK